MTFLGVIVALGGVLCVWGGVVGYSVPCLIRTTFSGQPHTSCAEGGGVTLGALLGTALAGTALAGLAGGAAAGSAASGSGSDTSTPTDTAAGAASGSEAEVILGDLAEGAAL